MKMRVVCHEHKRQPVDLDHVIAPGLAMSPMTQGLTTLKEHTLVVSQQCAILHGGLAS